MKTINLFHPYYNGKKIQKAMKSMFPGNRSNRWLGQGPKVDEFEKKFGEKFNYKYCLALNSGSAALELAYHLIGLKEGLSVEETIDKKRNYIKTRDLLKIKELAERPLKNEKEIKRVQINVLIWKLPQYEKECVNRIIDYTTHPYKLVCYDNRPNSFEGCNTAQIWNKLINESDCEYNLIMDSDAFIQRGQWLEKMVAALEENPNAAIIGPVSGFKNSGVPRYQEDYFVDGVPIEINDHISGFCFMIRRSLFKIIGPFMELFISLCAQ